MKYKVGDRVKIANDLKGNYADKMLELCGKTMTITDAACNIYWMEEGKGCWNWYDSDISNKISSNKDNSITKSIIQHQIYRDYISSNEREKMKKIVFNFEEHKGKVIMHCKTFEEAKLWCEFMHKNGLEWNGSFSCLRADQWWSHTENTCYSFNSNAYADLDFYIEQGYKIIEFSNIYVEEFTIDNLKSGMWVELRDENKYLVLTNCNTEIYGNQKFCLVNACGFITGDAYRKNLTNADGCTGDIVKIYDGNITSNTLCSNTKRNVIWQRVEAKKLWNGMTYEQAHRKMWNALADDTNLTKEQFIEKNNSNNDVVPMSNCFACESAYIVCKNCPLDSQKIGCNNGLYEKWYNSTGFEKAKLAHEIANLSWVEK